MQSRSSEAQQSSEMSSSRHRFKVSSSTDTKAGFNEETRSNRSDEETGAVESIHLSDIDDGYEHDLKRNFSVWSVLGLGIGLTASWSAVAASLVTGIQSGGPMMIIYGLILMACVAMCVGISLGELVSAYPENSGGQYYWTFQLAPEKYKRFWAYMCGYMGWFGAVFSSSSIIVSCAQGTVGMWALSTGNVAKTWQVFVAYQLYNAVIGLCNIYEKPLPYFTSAALYTSIGSFFIVTLTVVICARGHYADAKFVFVTFENNTGWSSSVIAFLTGLVNPAFSFSCLDAATHMAEEIHQPERMLPIAIIATVAIGCVTALIFAISMFFCITNLEEIFDSKTGVPILDIFYQAIGNKQGPLFLQFLIMMCAIYALISSHTWQARLSWSFSRDQGIWGSKYWSQVNKRTNLPIYAHIMSCTWCALIGCIYMGSTTAFGAFITASMTFLQLSYAIPIVCLLYQGRNSIKHGPFWLGKFGMFCNYVTVGWAVFVLVFFSFPSRMPVTPQTMNYSSVVIIGLIVYVVFYWFIRGHKYFATHTIHKNKLEDYVLQELENENVK